MDASKPFRAPSMFVSHGAGPFPLYEEGWESWRQSVSKLGSKLDGVKGIIVISAHWEMEEPHLTSSAHLRLYFDYDNPPDGLVLPQRVFEEEYAVPGNREFAADVAQHLRSHGFKPVLDEKRGLDHGVFVPLKVMRPQADIPIVQLSLLNGSDEQEATERNLKLGLALVQLRDLGYAVVGSGGSYHDFGTAIKAMMEGLPIPSAADDFEAYLVSVASITDGDERIQALRDWRKVPSSYVSHVEGHVDHFLPFLVAAGSGGNKPGRRIELVRNVVGPMSFFEW
ncbi:DODA-type extradiol aromatic ring-opening family dioxygenase [Aspergillus novofumigatus IBT 16806]|uniref:Catalytic LigB subunit of putative aromatic ring-opening dioxygenase n=1 Tax=Aspergillus novofumigatus (strain IBT 16806) TaxID=1392255 RepID=A0A2I1C1D2_ASPN1|nr:catalytic LigB subunit of putative aromatic ring-opening dioxygenase [Aspergillus novofumigatus IBT 16806]PKX91391.1 catalytic LigB subunit of putative aromatic ring-opening dioxygenase [Aspergillus novofumigatus IBT 16806]